MSKQRRARQSNKSPLRGMFRRLQDFMARLIKNGVHPDVAVRRTREKWRGTGAHGPEHWRRWWKANRKYQAQLGALRRMGCNVRHMPTSLNASWVP